jgi:hypothetical protein
MLALQMLEDSSCAGCGGLLSVTTNPDNADAYEVDPEPVRCHRCTAYARVASVHAQDNEHPHALRYLLTRAPRPAGTTTPDHHP